jgi:hypothetical protein
MAFLPKRHRSPPPQTWSKAEPRRDWLTHTEAAQWQPVKQRTSLAPIFLTAALASIITWMIRSSVEQAQTPHPTIAIDRRTEPPAALAPAQRPTGTRCSYPDGRINDWPNGPIDYFHFLPSCQGGRR